MRRTGLGFVVVLLAVALAPAGAQATFPYGQPGGGIAPGTVPSDVTGDRVWILSGTPDTSTDPRVVLNNQLPYELGGIRGASVVDANASTKTADALAAAPAWTVTTGRPDVTIAVLDSGIEWDDAAAMSDLRHKVRLNAGELPMPEHADGSACDSRDCNSDGVFDVDDYANDPRVHLDDPRRSGPPGVLTPQDLIIAFSDGTDADGNGFVDDIAGWDFLDNDNDPFDDVHYGHGTGEARDSTAEADNGNDVGTCPNCRVLPLRVGDSFVADVNNFAQAAYYATDNDVQVIQEALGTLNQSGLARRAVDYAYNHGTTVIASAADEAAQHHNWPSTYNHSIVVNSVTQYDSTFTPASASYLAFNGCTNFMTRVTASVPSVSCSSAATGFGSGMAGLIYSAARNARDAGKLGPTSDCHTVTGEACLITPNEVRQLMASGTIDGVQMADDVNFAVQPEPSCAAKTPGCTDPNTNTVLARHDPSPVATTDSYPARKGFDEFYGYGRVNLAHSVKATSQGTLPPEAEIDSPVWYAPIDPDQPSLNVTGHAFARGAPYSCRVYVAPGSEPNNALTSDSPPGDFAPVPSSVCNGSAHTDPLDGVLATISLKDLEAAFPVATDFHGAAPVPGPPNFNGRPNAEPYGFTIRLVVTTGSGAQQMTGQDRRNDFLHRDQDARSGFPKQLGSDGESSPVLADLDGDDRNELIFGGSDGYVHAMTPSGTELPGWPVRADGIPLHTGERAFASGGEPASWGSAIINSTAVGDLDGDGSPEVVAADLTGHVYAWSATGKLEWKREADPNYSGKPIKPFVRVRQGNRFRTQHGFLASPVLARLDGKNGPLSVVAAGMDRHLYVFDHAGKTRPGFPVLLLDRTKVTAIDPVTNAPTFKPDSVIGDVLNQGAVVDTPAVGDINGDGKPEIVVGTNEEYPVANDGGFAAGLINTTSLGAIGLIPGLLQYANLRVYAVSPAGEPGGPKLDNSAFVKGWPIKIGSIFAELLPVVGEGVTGSPVIGPVTCPSNSAGSKVGVVSDAGPAYLFNGDGTSCYSTSNGQPNALASDAAAGAGKYDTPAFPAASSPAFGDLNAGVGGAPSFVAPVAGVLRALDLAINDYQRGQDFYAAWNPETGQFRPGFPSPVNDLSFLTGPAVADVDGKPGEEIVGGTASLDTVAISAAGTPDAPNWPKLSSDWTVATPAIGTFGSFDTDAAATKNVISMTRAGVLEAYTTPAGACSPGSSPRFHHDNANSGDYDRDAVDPGAPFNMSHSSSQVKFNAPGDDLLCGTATRYEVVQSDHAITGADFASSAQRVTLPPGAPGTPQALDLPSGALRCVGVRAVDDQENAGPVTVEKLSGSGSCGDSGPTGPAGPHGSDTVRTGGIIAGAGHPGSVDAFGGRRCGPAATISRKSLHARRRHGFVLRGTARHGHCTAAARKRRVRHVRVAVYRTAAHHRCRFAGTGGRMSKPRRCTRPLWRLASIHTPKHHRPAVWSRREGRLARAGRYHVLVQAIDSHGQRGLAVRRNLRVRR